MPTCPTCNGRFNDGTFCPKDGTTLLADGEQPQSLEGQVVANYRLAKLLGQGGMGEVYEATHLHINKRVAVKVLHPEVGANPEALARFRQEAQSASSIGHENIVSIDDFGQMVDGRFYLTMEYLDGMSLTDAMQSGALSAAEALDVMLQVCEGLAAAHEGGIVHRDMKPENVFLTRRRDGSRLVKILDFGIAKVTGNDDQNLTKTGTVFGTPHYMSPEQALGQKIDVRADVYSVGVMMFEIFTGQVPFRAESFMGILSQHITTPAPSPRSVAPGRDIPVAVETAILKAMAKEPEKRFSTMKLLQAELQQAQGQVSAQPLQGAHPAEDLGTAATMAPAIDAAAPTSPDRDVPPTLAAGELAQASMGPSTSPSVIPKTIAGTGPATPPAAPPTIASATPPTIAPSASTPGAATASVQPLTVPGQPAAASAGKSKLPLLVVGAILLLGGGAFAFFFQSPSESKPKPTARPKPAVVVKSDAGVARADLSGVAAAQRPDAGAVRGRPIRRPVAAKQRPDATAPIAAKPDARPRPTASEADARVAAKPPVRPKKSFYSVTLVSIPSGAVIKELDGTRVARTPKTFKLRPGERREYRLVKTGRKSRKVTIVGGPKKTFKFRLTRGRESRQEIERAVPDIP